MKILVTGAAGFIGFFTAKALCGRGDEVVGIDNLNDYYDVSLKQARLKELKPFSNFRFIKLDISNREAMAKLFADEKFERVVHLAAQAGVRYSLENPDAYVDSNLVGFGNILEGCRHGHVEHLVYASSSSVYGANENVPFSTSDNVDHPVSLYAATKKSNELMAHAYSHLYQFPTTGLRFFTVYGPWGRPDMSPMIFANAIEHGDPIKVFNYGNHKRDFTYIEDIVDGVVRCLDTIPSKDLGWSGMNQNPASSRAPWKIYNIGRSQPVSLMNYIELLESALGKTAEKEFLPKQLGDVDETYADVDDLKRQVNYEPGTSLEDGISMFVDWFKSYKKIDGQKLG